MTGGVFEAGPPVFASFSEFAKRVLKINEKVDTGVDASPSSSPETAYCTQTNQDNQENPNPAVAIVSLATSSTQAMAFLNIDATPMLLLGFSRVIVNGRAPYTHVVTPRAAPRNEDLTIVMVNPPPNESFPFFVVREAILDLFVDRYGLQVKDIQCCLFGRGQAFVKLARVSDRDGLVAHSPYLNLGLFPIC